MANIVLYQVIVNPDKKTARDNISGKEIPLESSILKYNKIYNVIKEERRRSKIYPSMIRNYVVLEEDPSHEYTDDLFIKIPSDNAYLGKRAPQELTRSSGINNITSGPYYKNNHIF